MKKLTTVKAVKALENDTLDEFKFCGATLPTRLQAKKDGQQLAEWVNTLQDGNPQSLRNIYDRLLEKYRPFYEYEFKKAFQREVNYEL